MSVDRFVLLFRFAFRDLRGGLRGFGIFLACIAIGVAAIVGVGSTARSLSLGLEREGRTVLGGDLSFGLIHRQLNAAEQSYLQQAGRLSSLALLRAMARSPSGEPTLVEIKAVDDQYPPTGSLIVTPNAPLAESLAPQENAFGALADAEFAARLDLKPGDQFLVGDASFILRGLIASEPDRLAGGIGFGPRVLISQAALQATGLIQPGSLIRWMYRLNLDRQTGKMADDDAITATIEAANARFPEAGWEVRTRSNVSPQLGKSLDRLTQFLTLIGLTALTVGGVGIANAVAGFVEAKQRAIATLKSLGADGAFVFALMLSEILLIALLSIAIGDLVGALFPFVIDLLFGALLPFKLAPGIFPQEWITGLIYGFLTTLACSLAPLALVHDVSPVALFSDRPGARPALPRRIYIVWSLITMSLLVLAVLLLGRDPRMAGAFMLAAAFALALLRGIAFLFIGLARRLPHFGSPIWRLALANIHRPGAPTASVVLSLGLGITLMVALATIDGNLRLELNKTRSEATPSFFFADIQSAQAPAFDAFIKERTHEARLEEVPLMRGRLMRIGATPVEQVKAKENVAWVLEGDRGLTFAATQPPDAKLTKGAWWPADYAGPALVSLDGEIAEGLGLGVGDTLVVNVLGRNITATVANLRSVNWRTLGINFVMIFSPNTFAGAPHSRLASLTFAPGGGSAAELTLLRDVAHAFPSITTIRVKDTLDAITKLAGQLSLAIRGASSVALVSAILVLAGALAAGRRARLYDAVVLKVLGMTRWRLAQAYAIEYFCIGLVTSIFGVLVGMAAARAVVVNVMTLDFSWLWTQAAVAALGGTCLTLALGFLGTFGILGRRPSAALRSLG